MEIKRAGDTAEKQKQPKGGKEDYAQKKENEKLVRKTQAAIASVEKRIGELEAEAASWDAKLADPASHGIDMGDASLFDRYNALKASLAAQVHEWEKLSYELELLETIDN